MTKRPLLWLAIWAALLYSIVIFLPQSSLFSFSYEDDAMIVELPKALWHLGNFDGAHYQNISNFGYIAKFQTAFFPLYPLLINIFSFLTKSNLLSALIISLASIIIAVPLFSKFSSRRASLLALLTFPLSFFFLAGYTESLFLALSLGTWLSFRKKRYLLSGIIGFFAALSRFYGILLLPSLLLEFFLILKPSQRTKINSYKPVLPLLLIPVGLLAYMAYLQVTFSDPLQFIHALQLWGKSSITFPLQTVYRYFKIFLTVSPSLFQYWIALLEFSALLLGLWATFAFYKSKQYSYALYIFLGILIPTFTGTLQSLPRYLLVLFPLYLLVEKLSPKVIRVIIPLGLGLQILLFSFFLTGHFVS